MNASDDETVTLEEQIPKWIYGVILPVVCVWGIMAAMLCIAVFSRKQMRSSLNLYLAGLSWFDLLLLTMSILIYLPMQVCVEQGNRGPMCHFFWTSTLVTYPVSLTAQMGSVWTCVAVTVDRFLAVNYPLHSKIWCTPRRAMTILILICVVSIAYKIPSFFELQLDDTGRLRPTELRQSQLYIKFYMTYGYSLFVLFIPWSAMIVLNFYVVLAVHRAYRIRRSLQTNNTREERDRRSSRCTVMALVMILTFVVFNLLAAVNNIIEAFGLAAPSSSRISIGNLLVCLNSASNIIIYSLFGRRFRQVSAQMLCGRHPKCMQCFQIPMPPLVASEWERETATRRTSVEVCFGLLSTRNSRRYSKRVSLRAIDNSPCRDKRESCSTLIPDRAAV